MDFRRDLLTRTRWELRNVNFQQARRAAVALSEPIRGPIQFAARRQASSDSMNRPIWGTREVGEFHAVPTDFASTMPVRPYDQSTVVLAFENGEATFRNMHALDGQRRVLYEEQLSFGALPIALERLEPVEQRFARVAYLSNTLPSNFYHWLLLVLPMLRFYSAADCDIEKVYVGEPLQDWQRRSLDFVGLSEDMVVTQACAADVAHVAVATRPINGVPPAQVLWARSAFLPTEPAPGHRKLFVGRGQNIRNRIMVDEERLAEALEDEFGFEYVTTAGMSLDDEIEMFGRADAVIAPFGAALTNLLFAPRGTKVLELQPYDNDFSIVNCYQEMSAVLGNPHGMIRGEPTPRKKRGLLSDIQVPVEDVLRETEKMLSH